MQDNAFNNTIKQVLFPISKAGNSKHDLHPLPWLWSWISPCSHLHYIQWGLILAGDVQKAI